ncbi:MAG: hypothetical protein WAK60_08995 [Sedimentisphaerales bacterium]
MERTIDYLEKDGIVSAKVSGVMDWDENKRFAGELCSFAKKHGMYKTLIDFRQMQSKLTILQIDDMPNVLREIGVGPEFKTASVYDPAKSHSHEFEFFNNAATLRHIRVKQFTDPDEALTWLKSD